MKAVHFWSTYEIPQIEHFGYLRQYSGPLRGSRSLVRVCSGHSR